MPNEEVTALLGGWEGYRVGFVERHEGGVEGAGLHVCIELIRRVDVPMICSGCGQVCERYHDWEERWIRDLVILDAETRLLVQRFRVACPACGPQVEHLSWLPSYARVTGRLARSVARLCKVLTIKHVAKFYGLSWDAVKRIDLLVQVQLQPLRDLGDRFFKFFLVQVSPPCREGTSQVVAVPKLSVERTFARYHSESRGTPSVRLNSRMMSSTCLAGRTWRQRPGITSGMTRIYSQRFGNGERS